MATRRSSSTQYGPAAKKAVASALHREKQGTLKSGAGRHPKVKSRKQAIAIGLSEARKQGAKVPPRRAGSQRNASGKPRATAASRKRTPSKRATPKQTASKRPARKQATSKRTTRKPTARKAH
jgi:hypothetical protein